MKPGPTGDFPDGKLNPTDEGGLDIAISALPNGTVRIDFGKKIAWFAMSREQAYQFAKMIMARAVDESVVWHDQAR